MQYEPLTPDLIILEKNIPKTKTIIPLTSEKKSAAKLKKIYN